MAQQRQAKDEQCLRVTRNRICRRGETCLYLGSGESGDSNARSAIEDNVEFQFTRERSDGKTESVSVPRAAGLLSRKFQNILVPATFIIRNAFRFSIRSFPCKLKVDNVLAKFFCFFTSKHCHRFDNVLRNLQISPCTMFGHCT